MSLAAGVWRSVMRCRRAVWPVTSAGREQHLNGASLITVPPMPQLYQSCNCTRKRTIVCTKVPGAELDLVQWCRTASSKCLIYYRPNNSPGYAPCGRPTEARNLPTLVLRSIQRKFFDHQPHLAIAAPITVPSVIGALNNVLLSLASAQAGFVSQRGH